MKTKKNILEFYHKYFDMTPMKYYDNSDHTRQKAQDMITNKDNQFRGFLKADGEWSRAIIGEDWVIMQSRSKSTVTGEYGRKEEHVPHIVKELLENYPAGTVLLGELSYRDITKTSRNVGSILRSKAPLALTKQKKEKLIFRVFDCLAYQFVDLYKLEFDQRFKPEYVTPASVLHMREPMAQYIEVVEEIEGDFMEYANKLWHDGGEGIIIVRRDMKYSPGSRTAWKTLKIKKKLGELDAKIIDTLDATVLYNGSEIHSWPYWGAFDGQRRIGTWDDLENQPTELDEEEIGFTFKPITKPNYYGWPSAIEVEYKGRTIKVASGLTDEDKAYLATPAAKEAIESGSLYAVITGMSMTKDSIRHPVFVDFRHK